MTREVQECRACLKMLEEEVGHRLFEAWFTPWAVRGALIADDLAKFADIEITEEDEFSKVICSDCYQRLSDACTFMITVQMNDNILRSRLQNTSAGNTENTSWPQPIQINKSGNLNVSNSIEVEVKQEVLSEDENRVQMDEDWEPTMDIKIEPEEIVAPVQSSVEVNGTNNKTNDGPSSNNGSEEHLDSTIKQEAMSGDELLEDAPDLPLDCMLCSKEFHSVSGLKAHVIAHHSYGGVNRKDDKAPSSPAQSKPNNKDITCHTCSQRFKTRTDLMLHKSCHSKHVCYVCDAKFDTFLQLSRHGPRCSKKRVHAKMGGQSRSPSRPQQLSEHVNNDTEMKLTKTSTLNKLEPVGNLPWQSKDIKAKVESPAIEDMVVEKVQDLIKSLPSTEEMEIEPSPTKSDNELETSGSTSQNTRKLEVIKVKIIDKPPQNNNLTEVTKEDPYELEIEPQIHKNLPAELEESKSLNDEMKLDLDQEQSENRTPIHNNTKIENGTLIQDGTQLDGTKFENRILTDGGTQSDSTEDTKLKNRVLTEDGTLYENRFEPEESAIEQGKELCEILRGQITDKPTEEMQTEPIQKSKDNPSTDAVRTNLSQKPECGLNEIIITAELIGSDSSQESKSRLDEMNIPVINTKTTISISVGNCTKPDVLPQSKELSLKTIEENSLHLDRVESLQSQGESEMLLSIPNTIGTESIEQHNPIEKEISDLCLEQKLEQDNSSNAYQDDSMPAIPDISQNKVDELSEMKVHLAINPLNKDTELFDTDMEIADIECAKN